MGIIKQALAHTLELLGIGIGDKPIPTNDVAELKGFRPYPGIRIPSSLDHEWQVGFYWYLKRIEGETVLDTGYKAHEGFTQILGNLGLHVAGVDLQQGSIDKVDCIQAPVWDMPIPRASIDTLIANSLLEHIGLDCYGQPDKVDAVGLTLQEFASVLKPRGVVLMQIPYSSLPILIEHKGERFYIPWTCNDLDNLAKHFIIEEETYYIWARGKWVEVGKAIADRFTQGGGFPSCIVYVRGRNHE